MGIPAIQFWAGLIGVVLGLLGFVTLETAFFRFGLFDKNKMECYDCYPSGVEEFLYIFSPFSMLIGLMMISTFVWKLAKK
jgi:hypothetical protein